MSEHPAESATKMQELLNGYQALRQSSVAAGMPEMTPAGLQRDARTYADPESLWEALLGCEPKQGWLQFQSRQMPFRDGLPTREENWGALLAAEAVCNATVSLSVRRDAQECWILTRIQHHDLGSLLCDEIIHLAHHPNLGALRYRRYWRTDERCETRQIAACFIGFSAQD